MDPNVKNYLEKTIPQMIEDIQTIDKAKTFLAYDNVIITNLLVLLVANLKEHLPSKYTKSKEFEKVEKLKDALLAEDIESKEKTLNEI
jgi:hypothetical protein